MDDFKVVEVRAPLVIGAHAWSVENGMSSGGVNAANGKSSVIKK